MRYKHNACPLVKLNQVFYSRTIKSYPIQSSSKQCLHLAINYTCILQISLFFSKLRIAVIKTKNKSYYGEREASLICNRGVRRSKSRQYLISHTTYTRTKGCLLVYHCMIKGILVPLGLSLTRYSGQPLDSATAIIARTVSALADWPGFTDKVPRRKYPFWPGRSDSINPCAI